MESWSAGEMFLITSAQHSSTPSLHHSNPSIFHQFTKFTIPKKIFLPKADRPIIVAVSVPNPSIVVVKQSIPDSFVVTVSISVSVTFLIAFGRLFYIFKLIPSVRRMESVFLFEPPKSIPLHSTQHININCTPSSVSFT